MSDRIIAGQNHGAQLDHRGREAPRRNKLGSGISAMILSYHDSVPPTFADKQVNAYGRVPSPGWDEAAIMRIAVLCVRAKS